MDIKNALSHYSGVFHRPWSELLYLYLALAKVRKNPELPKKFGIFFDYCYIFSYFLFIFSVSIDIVHLLLMLSYVILSRKTGSRINAESTFFASI